MSELQTFKSLLSASGGDYLMLKRKTFNDEGRLYQRFLWQTDESDEGKVRSLEGV